MGGQTFCGQSIHYIFGAGSEETYRFQLEICIFTMVKLFSLSLFGKK